MKSSLFSAALVGIALTASLAFVAPALAATITYKADISAASVVPPTDSKGTGTLTVTYDTTTKVVTWKGTYGGLSGDATAAHFHGPAAAGKNAGVAVPFKSAASPLEGSATLTDAQAADLDAGNWYVNIHTKKFPDGEIRGQVVKGQ